MHSVVVVGDANVDIIVHYPRFLNEERTRVEYPSPYLLGGGTSANTAAALARLGVGTKFVGTVGKDQYGKFVERDLQNEGIDTSNLVMEEELNTVGVFAFIDEQGERYLWGWPRVDQSFKFLDMDKINMEAVLAADWIHSSGMSLVYETSARSTIIELFKRAYEKDIPTSFDLNLRVDNGVLDAQYNEAVREVMKYTTYLLGSGKEEFAYLGQSGDWEANAREFVTNKRTVIVRNGQDGSVGLSSNERAEVPAFTVQVEDTVGAGDVYNAGFIKAALDKKSLSQCLLMGNAVAGYTVSGKGARCCPTGEQVVSFIDENTSPCIADAVVHYEV